MEPNRLSQNMIIYSQKSSQVGKILSKKFLFDMISLEDSNVQDYSSDTKITFIGMKKNLIKAKILVNSKYI